MLFLVGCSNSSADVVPKIPDMACKQVGESKKYKMDKCEDKETICYVVNNYSYYAIAMQCFKK
jgi:hypothetical protein